VSFVGLGFQFLGFGSAEFCAFVLNVAQQIKEPVGESLGAMRFQGCKRLSLDCNGDDV
jgi:hypothetical protein